MPASQADLLLEAGEPARVICSAAARVGAGTVVIGRGSAAGDFGRLAHQRLLDHPPVALPGSQRVSERICKRSATRP